MDRGLVAGGLSHRQPSGGSNWPGIGLRIGSHGVVPGTAGTPCVQPRLQLPRLPLTACGFRVGFQQQQQGSNVRKDDGHGGRRRRSGTGWSCSGSPKAFMPGTYGACGLIHKLSTPVYPNKMVVRLGDNNLIVCDQMMRCIQWFNSLNKIISLFPMKLEMRKTITEVKELYLRMTDMFCFRCHPLKAFKQTS